MSFTLDLDTIMYGIAIIAIVVFIGGKILNAMGVGGD